MVVHNPNNWHWVDKNCIPWSRVYFEENFCDLQVKNDGISYTIDKVNSLLGDCDVTQRKGKVKCIFDMKVELSVVIVQEDRDDGSASITIPEFVHDQEEDEFEFIIKNVDHESQIKKHLVPAIKEKLLKFQPDLIAAHSKDMQHTT